MTSRKQVFVALFVLATVFVAGLYGGNWLSDHDAKRRVTAAVRGWLGKTRATVHEQGFLQTQFYKLKVRQVVLEPFDGLGGAITAFGDDVLFVSTKGRIGLLRPNDQLMYAEQTVPMNLDGLYADPLIDKDNSLFQRFRVADILLKETTPGRGRLYVSHHYYVDRCVEIRVSAIDIVVADDGFDFPGPWDTAFSAQPCLALPTDARFTGHEIGGRMLPDGDDALLLVVGHHGTADPRAAMDPHMPLGKLLRIDLNTGAAEILVIGLRNPQGMARDSTGRLWASEHGPEGGDELNLLVEGNNYGYPEVTYGLEYGFSDWPFNPQQGRHESYTKPAFAWVPAIGVSAMVFSRGPAFPLWQGDLMIASMRAATLYRTRIEGGRVTYLEPIPVGMRIRDIARMPDGRFAILADGAQMLILSPAGRRGAAAAAE